MKEEKAGRFFCSLFYCVNQTEKPLISVVACLLQLAPSDGSAATFPVSGDGFRFAFYRFMVTIE